MTSMSVLSLLAQVPDAKGTVAFLEMTRSVIDAIFEKKLDALTRIENAWYAVVFFIRYWRQWICLHPLYTLGNNFITQNAQVCIELNAHSLIMFLITLCDNLPHENKSFLP